MTRLQNHGEDSREAANRFFSDEKRITSVNGKKWWFVNQLWGDRVDWESGG